MFCCHQLLAFLEPRSLVLLRSDLQTPAVAAAAAAAAAVAVVAAAAVRAGSKPMDLFRQPLLVERDG